MTIRLKTEIKNLKTKEKPVYIATFFEREQPDMTSAGELLYKILKESKSEPESCNSSSK